MRAFIEDYLDWVSEYLGDPGLGKRLTAASLLRDLHTEHLVVYEDLLKVSGDESVIGYTETDIVVESGKEFYSFPGNFRQFIDFELRLDGNPNNIMDRMPTIPVHSKDRGIIISSPERGFRISPVPSTNANQTWTLRYQKQPIILHWGYSPFALDTRFNLQGFEGLKPKAVPMPEEQGMIVQADNYYAGEMVHFLGESNSEARPLNVQSHEVTRYNPSFGGCTLRTAIQGKGSGAKYEFRTFLPRGYDKLLACSVALGKATDRTDPEKHRLLIKERKKLFAAARNYFRTTTSDRAPRRLGRGRQTVDPMAYLS